MALLVGLSRESMKHLSTEGTWVSNEPQTNTFFSLSLYFILHRNTVLTSSFDLRLGLSVTNIDVFCALTSEKAKD